MQMYWEYSGCDLDDERHIEKDWERIQPELAANFESLSDPPTELRVAVDHDDTPSEWRIMAALHLPGKTLAVEVTAADLDTAMDKLLTGLSREIDRLGSLPIQATKRTKGLKAIVSILARSHRLDRREAFFSFLTPLVASIAPYVHRELQLCEIEERIASEETSVPDILDEVLCRSWEQFDERPSELPLDLWLIRLADQVLESNCMAQMAESLDNEVSPPSTEPDESQRDYWTEHADYPETIELHEIIAGQRGGDAWDETDLEDKQTNLARLLAGIPHQQRQALVLSAVHGFTEAEIADFQDRSQAEVQRDIESAKQTIAQQLDAE